METLLPEGSWSATPECHNVLVLEIHLAFWFFNIASLSCFVLAFWVSWSAHITCGSLSRAQRHELDAVLYQKRLQLFLCPGLSGMNWTLFCPRWCCFKAFCEIPTPSQVSSLLRVNEVKQEIINTNFYSCRHIKLPPVSNYDQFYCDKA